MYQLQASVATSLPVSQCLLVPYLSTDSLLSFASKIIFVGLFGSFLEVLSCANVNIFMPVPTYQCQLPVATRLPSLTMPASATSVH